MRVSEQQRFIISNKNVEAAKDKNMAALTTLSSQKRISTLHDDPVGVSRVVKHRSVLSDYDSFARNVDFSKGFVEITESSLSSIADRLGRAHELAISMANDTFAQDSRQATAREIEEITQQVIQLANSKYNGRHVFSGFRTKSPAIDGDGNFLGDDGAIFVQVGHGNLKQINVAGRRLFESDASEKSAGHLNMIDTLELLKDGLMNDDKHLIYKIVDELSFQMNKTNSFQASVGATWQTLEQVSSRLEVSAEEEVKAMSRIEDADLFDATSNFRKSEATLQSTLLASSKFLQPSLLNFLQ